MPYKNKEEKAAYNKEYHAKNKVKIAAQQKEFFKTPNGIKSKIISNWKTRGTKGDLSMFYDDKYLPASNCDVCDKVFKSTKDKCMDHSHTTGEIRHVLCHRCNSNDFWIKVLANKNK
tara:strand:- start:478 stop:828 length:351 start_codon:yes stop_codon:yes gene_type:complete